MHGTCVDGDRNRVVIQLFTRRTDHAQYFAERYGPAVLTEVTAAEPTRLDCNRVLGYRVSPTGRSLRLLWFTGGGAELGRIELAEEGRRVGVGVVGEVPKGFRTDDLRLGHRVVRLERPLRGRPVIDAGTGTRVRRLRCRGLPRCFAALERARRPQRR